MGTSGFVELEGGRIYFEVDGEGHALLLTHGGLGSLRMWDRQVPAFSERYRVIRYDTRGFGRTQTDDVGFVNLDDAVAVLDQWRHGPRTSSASPVARRSPSISRSHGLTAWMPSSASPAASAAMKPNDLRT
jgi:pimeloyl-ACP methyl ester carboxylesterase